MGVTILTPEEFRAKLMSEYNDVTSQYMGDKYATTIACASYLYHNFLSKTEDREAFLNGLADGFRIDLKRALEPEKWEECCNCYNDAKNKKSQAFNN